ncbi:hypothetical protein Cus16_2476 [Curtobacterium sp. ER1/6]|nr:hypothetical protein Cus16_2476 [Curtobacterium sp. ER1/6]
MCVFSLAEFPEASGWWMLGFGGGLFVLMLTAPAVAIMTTRRAVWFVVVPFWAVRVRLDDIASIESVDVRPLEDFGGWGIKGASRRKGLLLAANGQKAIRITRGNGQVFLATSEDPERVIAAFARPSVQHL